MNRPDRLASSLSLILVSVVIGACAGGSPYPPRAQGEPAPQVIVAADSDQEALASCGRATFPLAALETPTAAEEQAGPEFDALRNALVRFRVDLDVPHVLTWRLVARTATDIAFLTDVGPGTWMYASVVAEDGGWVPGNAGECQLHMVLSDDLGAATWWLDERFPRSTVDATELAILVEEKACSTGSYATGRIAPALVAYATDAVVVTLGVREIGGGCPGNPATPAVLVLAEPIGERQLLDGYFIPPAPPIEPRDGGQPRG